jgi:hypothetical protein
MIDNDSNASEIYEKARSAVKSVLRQKRVAQDLREDLIQTAALAILEGKSPQGEVRRYLKKEEENSPNVYVYNHYQSTSGEQ